METKNQGFHYIKMMMKRAGNSARLRRVLILLPGVFALIGYTLYASRENNWLWILYVIFDALKVYTGSFEASLSGMLELKATMEPAKYYFMCVCLEIGRWGGLLVAGTFLFQFLRDLYARMDAGRKARNDQVIAVHGSSHYKRLLRDAFGPSAIIGDFPEKFAAHRHVLAFDSDHQLLEYLNAHFTEFPSVHASGKQKREHQVYLCLRSASHAKYSHKGFIINNMAEDCARLYWKQHYIRRYSGKTEQKIVLIGFGHYGQALLSQALMVNVFAQGLCMEYHIFGDDGLYFRLHKGIERFASVNAKDETKDSIFFHQGGWENHLDLLADADRVILCHDTDEENIYILSYLDGMVGDTPIHIRSRDVRMLKALYSEHQIEENDSAAHICIFGTDRMLYTREVLLDESLMEIAKMIHAHYARHESIAQCKTCQNRCNLRRCVRECPYFIEDWNSLGVFLQRSNVCAADHMDVKLREVLQQDCTITKETLSAYAQAVEAGKDTDAFTPYLRLEHNRWMRYHYFNGWNYADIPAKDKNKKLHPMLVPYDDLDEKEKRKDLDGYLTLSKLQKYAVEKEELKTR